MTPESAAAEIVYDHVTKRYAGSGRPAVDDLSLTIPHPQPAHLPAGRRDRRDDHRRRPGLRRDALFAAVQRTVTPKGLGVRPELVTIVPAGAATAIATEQQVASAERV